MLTSIDVDSDNFFSLPIAGVTPKDSLLVRSITGLGPTDVTLFIGDYATDGGTYQGRRVGNRNVVMIVDLNPNPANGETVSGLREKLYKAFMDPLVEADHIKLGLHLDDGRELYLYGYTEKLETDMFNVETMAQISIICPDPYVRDEVPTIKTHLMGWTRVPFNYKGTAETGFQVEIHVNTPTPKLILANNTVTDDINSSSYHRGRMILNRAFSYGDVIEINTVRGEHKIWLYHSGSTTPISIASSLDVKSSWLELHSQSNLMDVYGTTSDVKPAVIRELKYVQAYWGI